MGVWLAYARGHGHALLARALSLPKVGTDDRARGAPAGVPAAQRFATKPHLARPMRQRAFEAGVPATWGTGDSVYGDDRRRRGGRAGPGLCPGGLGASIGLVGWSAAPRQKRPGGVGDGGLGAVERRRRGQRAALVGREVAAPGRAVAAGLAPRALGTPEAARARGTDGVRRFCATRDDPGHRGPGGWEPVDHGTVL
jgi:hypothetical protein